MLRRTIRFSLVGALSLASGVASADLPPPIGGVIQPRPPMWVPPAINTDMGRLPGNYCVQIQTAGLPLPGNTPVPPGGYPAITVQVGQIGEPNHIVDIYPQPDLEPPASDPRCNPPAGGRGGGFGFGPWFAAIAWMLFNPTELGHDDYISNADLERMRNEPLCCDWNTPPRRRGGAHGDPHFTTFDGLAYDFHGVGEFWLYRSAGQGLDVAGRFVAVGPRLSMTDAAAIAIVDPNDGVRHELSIFPGREQKLWLDGAPVEKRATIEGQSEYESMYADMMGYDYAGPTIDVYSRLPGDYYAIDDGTLISVFGPAGTIEVTRTSVEVQVVESDARGLLGDFDGDTSNDLRDTAGQVAISGPGLLSVNDALSSWRVAEAESPFHYFAGESWLAFQDFAFLDVTADPPAPTEAELYEAAMACLDVADPLHRAHCESDFIATGDPDVILAAAIAPPALDVMYEYSDGYQEIVAAEEAMPDDAAYYEDMYASQYDDPPSYEPDYSGYEPPYYE